MDNNLKAQIKSCRQLSDPKEHQINSKNNNTISKCKHNWNLQWLLAISKWVQLLNWSSYWHERTHSRSVIIFQILLFFPFDITAISSSFSQVPHVFGLISRQGFFHQAFSQSSNSGLQIDFCFLALCSSSSVLLHFKDYFTAIFSSLCLSKSALYLENTNLQLLWSTSDMVKLCSSESLVVVR